MRNTRGECMKEAVIKIFLAPLLAVLVSVMLLPAETFGASIKIRHVVSVYNDNLGENPVQLRWPAGVGCTDDHFVVADTANGRLLRYALEDGTVTTLGESKPFQVRTPLKVQINSGGDIYVLDGDQRRIVHLGPDGKFRDYVDPKGLPSPAEYVPKSFALDSAGNIYVLDIFSTRVFVLTPAGEFQREIKFPKDYGFFSDIAVDFKGDILLLDSVRARVLAARKHAADFSPLTKSLREYMRFPVNLTTDERGRIYLTDHNGSRMVVVGQDGSFLGRFSDMGWKEGLLNHPSQACLNSKGYLFIADTRNDRVQIFQLLR